MQLHHIGHIVKNAEDPDQVEKNLHLIASTIDPGQTAKICLYKNSQNELIELVEPLNEESPVWSFLQKSGGSFHHECYAATLDEIGNYTSLHKLTKIMGPVPAKIFGDQPVIFYISKDQKIVEFIVNSLDLA